MGGEAGQPDAAPWLPPGRYVWLPGRGRTFIRELAGPPGAPTLMLLHGWTATADLNWFACFHPLAERFRVIAIDHRGHGRGLRSIEPFRLEHCADDVAALARELGIDRFVPVGYSMGGPIAQLVWQRHRELVDGLVLCATSATFTGTMRERLLFGVAAGTSVVAGAVPIAKLTSAALARWNGWRSRRGASWWGFDQVARHDWHQIVEAGRAIGRFDSRALGQRHPRAIGGRGHRRRRRRAGASPAGARRPVAPGVDLAGRRRPRRLHRRHRSASSRRSSPPARRSPAGAHRSASWPSPPDRSGSAPTLGRCSPCP